MIFENFREMFGTACGTFKEQAQTSFGESWEIFGKWSEIFGKSSKTPSSVCLYNKKNITRELEDMNFMFNISRASPAIE